MIWNVRNGRLDAKWRLNDVENWDTVRAWYVMVTVELIAQLGWCQKEMF